MRSSRKQPAPVEPVEDEPLTGMRVGQVVGVHEDGRPRVDFPGNRRGPLPARTTLALDVESWRRAARERQEAVLFFDQGDASRPVLTGLLQQPSTTPLLDAVLARPLPEEPRVARVDGEEVRLTGREQVVLECGRASLTLRRDGKVILRGVDIVTQAEGVQRIRGGKIKIN